jgi:AsmA protein
MRKWLIGIVAVIVLVVAALIVVPLLIPTEAYKGQIVERVKSATGRDLAFNGPISLSVLPSFALTVSDVAFGNAPGASAKNMATFGKLQLQVQPLALLSGRLVIDSFVLVDPVIALEVDKQGHPNWQFAAPAGPAAASGTPPAAQPAPPPAGGAKPAGRTASPVDEIHLGDVRLVNGTITYFDMRTGQKQQVDKINAKLVLPDLGSPMQASGNADWNGKTVSLTLDLATPREFLSGAKTAVTVKLAAPAVKFDFKGDVASGDVLKLDGETALDIPSLRELATWTGGSLPPTSGGLGPLKIAGKLDVAGAKVNFSNAQITLDAINAKGDLAVDASGAKPILKGALDVDKLDLNPYLPPTPAATPAAPARAAPSAGTPPPTPSPAPAASANAGWSDQPIDMSGLKVANADFALTVGGLVFKKITIGKSALTLQLTDGKLAADLTRMELYEGSGKGGVRLDGAAAVPALEANFDLAKVQAAPLLHDVMDFDRLRGNANGNVAVTAHGKSERELIANLGGKGALDFLNGAIKGINIGALIRNPAGALVDPASQKDQETDFSEMSGTFTITNGILKNTDLELKAPLLRVAGAGTVDLPQRTVNYRIDPKVAMTAQGQGGKSDVSGIEVPVVVEGPWDHLTYRPQLDALLKDPNKALGDIKNLFGKPSPNAPASGTPPASGTTPAPSPTSNPADLLKGLFGGKKN